MISIFVFAQASRIEAREVNSRLPAARQNSGLQSGRLQAPNSMHFGVEVRGLRFRVYVQACCKKRLRVSGFGVQRFIGVPLIVTI